MIRKIKALGLAFVAVCAMSAVVAAGAQAGFTASSYPATGSGGQTTNHVFTVQGQKVTCEEVHFTGSLTKASEEITIEAEYGDCTAFGFVGAEVDMNSCHYVFTTEKPSPGSVHVVCGTSGDSITVVAGSCTVHIPAQTPTTNVIDYENKEGGVLVTSTASGIHSSVTDGGFLCPLSNASTDTTGSYTGSTLFTGEGVTVDVG